MFNDIFLLAGFTAEDSEWLKANGNEKLISLNERIISEGETPHEICVVISGLFTIISENGDHISTIGPGGILGAMTFLTDTVATVSVIAVKPNSVVFAIPRKLIAARLADDLNFAARFYRATAVFLTDRMKKLLDLFMTPPKTKSHARTTPPISGPIPLFNQEELNFDLIQRHLGLSTSISDIFNSMLKGNNEDHALIEREQHLSVATMSAESIKLLYEVAKEEGIEDFDRRVIQHKPSITAAEKQAILSDFQIQKTITLLIQNKFVLCSGIGDFKVQHKLLGKIATMLGLSRGTFDSYINPAIFVPEIELGLLRGMVSTFFSPGRITQLRYVLFLVPVSYETKDVAISLSPFESLILPSRVFSEILMKYAERAYPYLPFALLENQNGENPL